jgi:hypothetical protein
VLAVAFEEAGHRRGGLRSRIRIKSKKGSWPELAAFHLDPPR